MVKNLPAYAGDIRDESLIPESGRSPGGGHGNPLQYSCLGNPKDRGAWWATAQWLSIHWQATVYSATKNRMLLNDWANTQTQIFAYTCMRNVHVKGSGIWKRNQEYLSQNFPGGPRTRTLHSQGRGLGFDLRSGKLESMCCNYRSYRLPPRTRAAKLINFLKKDICLKSRSVHSDKYITGNMSQMSPEEDIVCFLYELCEGVGHLKK